MGSRYCMHCGMPVPRRARICPECGSPLKMSAPPNAPDPTNPRIFPEQMKPADKTHRKKHTSNKSAIVFAVGFIAIFSAAAFFIMRAGKNIENARSRHRENMMDAQRKATTTRPEIKIPEFSMPEISIPDIKLPEPPAAAFSVDSYAVEKNLLGETVLYVNLNYTNKAENKECFLKSFKISVQQDGEACKQTAGDPTRENHLLEHVPPDETVLISEAFIISTEKETNVSVTAFFSEGSCLEETILPHADGTVSVSE